MDSIEGHEEPGMVDGNTVEPRLGQLRLLVALDALLMEGNVGKAAARMGLAPRP